MTTQHTPGPWCVDMAQDSDGTIRSVDVREAAYGLFVAAVEAHTNEHADVMANARLIASAPDLLAALRACEQAFTRKAICDCDWHMGLQHKADCPRGAILSARAAIARVEGNT